MIGKLNPKPRASIGNRLNFDSAAMRFDDLSTVAEPKSSAFRLGCKERHKELILNLVSHSLTGIAHFKSVLEGPNINSSSVRSCLQSVDQEVSHDLLDLVFVHADERVLGPFGG